MGTHVTRGVSDLVGLLGLLSLTVAIYFGSGLRTPLPWHVDLFESVAWGKLFAAAVYAGLSVLFFFMFHRGRG